MPTDELERKIQALQELVNNLMETIAALQEQLSEVSVPAVASAPENDYDLDVETRAPPGHIINEFGMTLRILGTLPMTADGCVLGEGAKTYCYIGLGVVVECHTPTCVAYLDGTSEEESVDSSELYSTYDNALVASRKEI